MPLNIITDLLFLNVDLSILIHKWMNGYADTCYDFYDHYYHCCYRLY